MTSNKYLAYIHSVADTLFYKLAWGSQILLKPVFSYIVEISQFDCAQETCTWLCNLQFYSLGICKSQPEVMNVRESPASDMR